jgi:hypothetical protein
MEETMDILEDQDELEEEAQEEVDKVSVLMISAMISESERKLGAVCHCHHHYLLLLLFNHHHQLTFLLGMVILMTEPSQFSSLIFP